MKEDWNEVDYYGSNYAAIYHQKKIDLEPHSSKDSREHNNKYKKYGLLEINSFCGLSYSVFFEQLK